MALKHAQKPPEAAYSRVLNKQGHRFELRYLFLQLLYGIDFVDSLARTESVCDCVLTISTLACNGHYLTR